MVAERPLFLIVVKPPISPQAQERIAQELEHEEGFNFVQLRGVDNIPVGSHCNGVLVFEDRVSEICRFLIEENFEIVETKRQTGTNP